MQLARTAVRRARAWSAGSAPRGVAAVARRRRPSVGALAWAWWPDGQYRPVRGDEDWTVAGLVQAAAPGVAPAVAADAPPRLAPGRHLAVAMIPRGGATKERPALYVIRDAAGEPAVAVVSTDAPAAPRSATRRRRRGATARRRRRPGRAAPPARRVGAARADDAARAAAQDGETSTATAFPFKLPDAPRPGDTQALATGKADGGVTYDIAYAVVTVKDGADVDAAQRRLRAGQLQGVHDDRGLVPGRARRRPERRHRAGERRRGAERRLPVLHHRRVRQPDGGLADRRADAGARASACRPRSSASTRCRRSARPRAISHELADIHREINQALDDSGLRASRAATGRPRRRQTARRRRRGAGAGLGGAGDAAARGPTSCAASEAPAPASTTPSGARRRAGLATTTPATPRRDEHDAVGAAARRATRRRPPRRRRADRAAACRSERERGPWAS